MVQAGRPDQQVAPDEIAISGIGTIAAARVSADGGLPFIAVSMAASWIRPHPTAGSKLSVGYQDGSAHGIISDLSAFIGSIDPATHRILAAGDLNMIYGATEDNRLALPARYRTVTDRMEALGLEFMGPQFPAGRQAHPPPAGLPSDSLNVPTFHAPTQSPATAATRLDYASASRGFHESATVRAMNSTEERGASDHCRLLIDVFG